MKNNNNYSHELNVVLLSEPMLWSRILNFVIYILDFFRTTAFELAVWQFLHETKCLAFFPVMQYVQM